MLRGLVICGKFREFQGELFAVRTPDFDRGGVFTENGDVHFSSIGGGQRPLDWKSGRGGKGVLGESDVCDDYGHRERGEGGSNGHGVLFWVDKNVRRWWRWVPMPGTGPKALMDFCVKLLLFPHRPRAWMEPISST